MKASLLRPFGLALALIVALTAGGVREAVGVAAASSGELLAAELPAGVTIASAPTPVLATAVRSAVRKNSDKAVPILRVALLSRKKKKRADVPEFCDDYVALTRAALEAAPGQARALVEEATVIVPGCASALSGLLGDGGGSDGSSLPAFGTGYVLPGFAGAPGFSGSNPGGGIFVPVTPTGNR